MSFDRVKVKQYHTENQIKYISQAAKHNRRALECLLTAARHSNKTYKPIYKRAAQGLLYSLFSVNKLTHSLHEQETITNNRLMYGGELKAELMQMIKRGEIQLTRKGLGVDVIEQSAFRNTDYK